MLQRKVLFAGIGAIVVAGWCVPATGMWVAPDETVPLERLVENTKRYLSDHPEDAGAYALLGRVYSLAFALDVQTFDLYKSREEGGHPSLSEHDYFARPDRSWNRPGALTPEKQRQLMDSIRYYQKAVKIAPNGFTNWLGLGYMYHEGSREVLSLLWPFSDEPFDEELLSAVKRAWVKKALDAYEKAFQGYRKVDPDDKYVSDVGVTYPVALEIVDGIVSLLEEQPELDRSERKLLEKYRKEKESMHGKFRGLAITPIIFSLHADKPLSELLAPARVVNFDLAGDDIPRQWPWVEPGTAILVWDPDLTGTITSGRQLIGSVTWWLFWENGYQVLATLDDNADGWLAGEELAGLAVWVDANGNAISDLGEVTALDAAGIAEIAVHPAGKTGNSPFNPAGLRLRDGRLLPTYDWVTEPIASGPGASDE